MVEAFCDFSGNRRTFRIGNRGAVLLLDLLTFGIQRTVIGPEWLV